MCLPPTHTFCCAVDVGEPPSDLDDYQPAGMEALEILHNQLQLLVSDSASYISQPESVLSAYT